MTGSQQLTVKLTDVGILCHEQQRAQTYALQEVSAESITEDQAKRLEKVKLLLAASGAEGPAAAAAVAAAGQGGGHGPVSP